MVSLLPFDPFFLSISELSGRKRRNDDWNLLKLKKVANNPQDSPSDASALLCS
jgi:hypothetical protein